MESAIAPALRVLADWLGSPVLWVIAFVIAAGLQLANKSIGAKGGDRGAKGVWYVVHRYVPIPLGALVGLLPGLPVPGSFGTSTLGGVLFAASGGVIAIVGFDTLIDGPQKILAHFTKRLSGGPP